MSADWNSITIDEIKSEDKGAIAIGPFGSRMKSDCYVNEGIPVIRGTNITGGPTFEGEFVFITKEKADELGSCNVYKNDLVFPHRGSIGEVGIVLKDERYVISSSLMKLTCDPHKANPKFIYYFFKSKNGRHELLKNASQVGTPGIGQPLSSLKSISLHLPPIGIQNKISDVLSALDEKIYLNTQTNQTLESIAQAIFKSWFVDFEPVKAKMAILAEGSTREQAELAAMGAISGKSEAELAQLQQQNSEDYQQLAETAALFPSAMVDSELGEIPEGWEVKTLSDMINIIGGGTPNRSTEEYWNGRIPWFSIKDLPNPSDVFVIDTDEKITELGLKKSSTKLLPANTTIITARGTVGKLALIDKPMCMNQSCYGIAGKNGIEPIFNYFNLKEAISTLQRNTHGAVFDTITTKTFESYSSAFCGNLLASQFDQTAKPLIEKIKCNLYQIKYLKELRDSLLPKLLSGEIDITEIQSEVA